MFRAMHPTTRSLLAAHRCATDLEDIHRDRMVGLLERTQAPFSHAQYEPGHFTASAFVLSPDRRDVLLIWHDKLQRWLQPGGHIEPEDADPIAAARREVAEETMLDDVELVTGGLLDVDVHAIPPHKDTPGHEHFDLRFAFISGTRTVAAADGCSDVRWVPLTEVAGVDTDESVMRAVRRLLT